MKKFFVAMMALCAVTMGFSGKPAGYMIIFCICAVAYLIGWTVMKILVPKHKAVVLK